MAPWKAPYDLLQLLSEPHFKEPAGGVAGREAQEKGFEPWLPSFQNPRHVLLCIFCVSVFPVLGDGRAVHTLKPTLSTGSEYSEC